MLGFAAWQIVNVSTKFQGSEDWPRWKKHGAHCVADGFGSLTVTRQKGVYDT